MIIYVIHKIEKTIKEYQKRHKSYKYQIIIITNNNIKINLIIIIQIKINMINNKKIQNINNKIAIV